MKSRLYSWNGRDYDIVPTDNNGIKVSYEDETVSRTLILYDDKITFIQDDGKYDEKSCKRNGLAFIDLSHTAIDLVIVIWKHLFTQNYEGSHRDLNDLIIQTSHIF